MRTTPFFAITLLCLASIASATDAPVRYGPHGGVVGAPPGAFVCIVYDALKNDCVVRAINEPEIEASQRELEAPPPVWMNASMGEASLVNEPKLPGLPMDNEFGLPGLMTTDLDARQTALVRCLAATILGRPLTQWNDPQVYERGIVETCEREAAVQPTAPNSGQARLPIQAVFIQEAAIILVMTQRLADANELFKGYAGRYALNIGELTGYALLRSAPLATSSVKRAGYALAQPNRVVVRLSPEAAGVCKALNLMQGRSWYTVPDSIPTGARAGCYASTDGFRFEYDD